MEVVDTKMLHLACLTAIFYYKLALYSSNANGDADDDDDTLFIAVKHRRSIVCYGLLRNLKYLV